MRSGVLECGLRAVLIESQWRVEDSDARSPTGVAAACAGWLASWRAMSCANARKSRVPAVAGLAVFEWTERDRAPKAAALSVGLIKRAVQSGADLPLESGLALERELQQRLFTSEDAQEGIAAFLEKRPPDFPGR